MDETQTPKGWPGDWKKTQSSEIGWEIFTNPELFSSLDTQSKEPREHEIEYAQDFIDTYKTFASEFGQPETVYYPCCWLDGSPSKVFKHIIYVDREWYNVSKLKKEWYVAFEWDVTTFELEPKADVLIIVNPQVKANLLTKNLKSGWYVICNNYHDTADQLRQNPEFVFIKNLKTGKKKFKPNPNLENEEEFSGGDVWHFIFQKK